uniref:DNA translocase FtsK n=1 Tax=Diaphorobacter sp. TaxID=1934310 RepID=UPI00258E336C
MTYSLNTLNASSSSKSAPRTGAARFGHEIGLVLGLLGLVFWLLALVSYSAQDAAWSTSGAGNGQPLSNWVGRLGAWLADGSYFVLGFSVWWCVAAGVRAWFASLARWMRGDGAAGHAPWQRRGVFWGGLALLLCASTALEWSRLYRFEALLPGHAGGMLGYMTGPLAVRWLGFTGSGLAGVVVVVLGAALVFRFSWGHLAERLGGRIDALVQRGRARREKAKDVAVGRRAAREREEVVQEERHEIEVQHPQPVTIIEPVLSDVVQSTRVVKERQKPLFSEMPDSNLPQVDLLDAAQARQETVSPETLEMTSRLIEKKLKDFGVDVTVVAAMPGPVITRYEIEPATGVKGSQIVNLAKDLARSLSLVSIRVIETIPGKNFMALELPNAKRQTIRLSEILGSQVYHDAKSLLTMGLGKDIVGAPVVADLAKMPHVLVAGTTGSGKSVGINAMILSLLYKSEPKDVRLILVDPKMLELSVYEGIPHLLAPVVTDMNKAANALHWCVGEMERRYKL